MEPHRTWPRTGTLRDRWPTVPMDLDEAERFAVEYAIGLRARLDELRTSDIEACRFAGRHAGSTTVLRSEVERIGRQRDVAGVEVVLTSDGFRWAFTLPAGLEYEDPRPLADRFVEERNRVERGQPR